MPYVDTAKVHGFLLARVLFTFSVTLVTVGFTVILTVNLARVHPHNYLDMVKQNCTSTGISVGEIPRCNRNQIFDSGSRRLYTCPTDQPHGNLIASGGEADDFLEVVVPFMTPYILRSVWEYLPKISRADDGRFHIVHYGFSIFDTIPRRLAKDSWCDFARSLYVCYIPILLGVLLYALFFNSDEMCGEVDISKGEYALVVIVTICFYGFSLIQLYSCARIALFNQALIAEGKRLGEVCKSEFFRKVAGSWKLVSLSDEEAQEDNADQPVELSVAT